MLLNMRFKFSRYHQIELIFFLIYFYVFSFFTDLEYNFWEKQLLGISHEDVEFVILYGTSSMISFLVFYKMLQYCLEGNHLWTFLAFLPVFLVGVHFYDKGIYLLVSHLSFVSEESRKEAYKFYQLKTLAYSVIYMFREFLGIGSLAYFIHSAKQKEQMKLLREQQLISELTYLKAQLKPHFFFNTLNNIYALALQQSAATAPLVVRLSEMMRHILYKSERENVLLKDEIDFLRNYVEVESIRYRAAIRISFEVQGIDDECEITPLLLLPFIENAFKHGIQEETGEGFVQVVICKTENELIMEVSNSIADSGNSMFSGGIGLVNVMKRLEIQYPGKYILENEIERNIYQVRLTLVMK